MSTATKQQAAQQPATHQRPQQQGEAGVPAIAGPRLPYHPVIEERFGVDKASWKALVEAIFPAAQSTESVILALSYCRARNLDPFKRNVHIVPIWDKQKRKLVDTVWPGIGELRTTAFRTAVYAGRDATVFGPDIENEWPVTDQTGATHRVKVRFPEWAQVTVYRMVKGNRVAFQGPRVYWMETFSSNKGGEPNSMWVKRPRGQLDKCAEAAALRAAFPEELGDDFIDAEAGLIVQHGSGPQQGVGQAPRDVTPRPRRADFIGANQRSDDEGAGEDGDAGEDAAGEDGYDPDTGEITEGAASAEDSAATAAEPQDHATGTPSPEPGPAAGSGGQGSLLGDEDGLPTAMETFGRLLAETDDPAALEREIAKQGPWLDRLDHAERAAAEAIVQRHRARLRRPRA